MTESDLCLARIIWDYHQLRHTPIPADVILALGTNDLRVAEYAAGLYHRRFGERVVCTGGLAHHDDLLATGWERPEAEMYAEVLEREGVPRDRILLEMRATNTAENIRFARELLGGTARNLLIVVKPFMQRRVWATMAVEWPEVPASVASPPMTLDEYFTEELAAEKIVNILLGDLQRIWIYAQRGWSAPQRVPADVLDAYNELAARGYTRHLLPES